MNNKQLSERLTKAITEKYKIVIFKSDKEIVLPINTIDDLPARIGKNS